MKGVFAISKQAGIFDANSWNLQFMKIVLQFFDKAAKYWNQALKLAPDNYPGAQNWLKITGREIIKD